MIPRGARGQQWNARRVESYTKTGTSGVRVGAEVPLGDDQPRKTTANGEPPDDVRILPAGLTKRRNARTHQRAGGRAQRESVGFVPTVGVALNQEAGTGHHPQNPTHGRQGRQLSVRRISAEQTDSGACAEQAGGTQRLYVTGSDAVPRVSRVEQSDRIADKTRCEHDGDLGAVGEPACG